MTNEANTETLNPKEAARKLMVAAAQFAGAALQSYTVAYPEQAALLAHVGGGFAVRVSEILTENPRCALV